MSCSLCIYRNCPASPDSLFRHPLQIYQVKPDSSGNNQKVGGVLAEVPKIGYVAPTISGPDGHKIKMTKNIARESWMFEREDYGNNEDATITISGMADITFEQTDMEKDYDYIMIEGQFWSEPMDSSFDVAQTSIGIGQCDIRWHSDHNITTSQDMRSWGTSRWVFELFPTGDVYEVDVEVEDLLAGMHLAVVPVHHRWNERNINQCPTVRVEDVAQADQSAAVGPGQPPKSRPLLVEFDDEDLDKFEIRGTIYVVGSGNPDVTYWRAQLEVAACAVGCEYTFITVLAESQVDEVCIQGPSLQVDSLCHFTYHPTMVSIQDCEHKCLTESGCTGIGWHPAYRCKTYGSKLPPYDAEDCDFKYAQPGVWEIRSKTCLYTTTEQGVYDASDPFSVPKKQIPINYDALDDWPSKDARFHFPDVIYHINVAECNANGCNMRRGNRIEVGLLCSFSSKSTMTRVSDGTLSTYFFPVLPGHENTSPTAHLVQISCAYNLLYAVEGNAPAQRRGNIQEMVHRGHAAKDTECREHAHEKILCEDAGRRRTGDVPCCT